jgi:3-oxoacyl-[acyl-carrier-protein] synthase-3
MLRTIITGTGSYIPPVVKKNIDFASGNFYHENADLNNQPSTRIIEKFKQITGIEERRYAPEDMNTSDVATLAARMAVQNSGVDMETIDQIIVAHNYGNVPTGTIQPDTVPSIASRIKHNLGIRNPACVPYDILFGCPGWLQGLIQADMFCRAGAAKKCLVIGADVLSRMLDWHDRDSMIFSDGAGACLVEYKETTNEGCGILSACTRSDTVDEAYYIHFGPSNAPDANEHTRYIKMKGRKVYEYALKYVPEAMKQCLDRSGVPIGQLKKIFIHQANEKMDEAIIKEFYKLYDLSQPPENIMPMSIHWLGNSSVATIPTLYHLVLQNQVEGHSLQAGDVVIFASVGAGMNINAVCYRY